MTERTFGVTPYGFVKKRLQDIKLELEQAFTEAYGEINTEADSVFGQLIGVESKVLADIWEAQESVYYSQYPNSAEGVSLDYVAILLGITRLAAKPTTVTAAALGKEGTRIPVGAICTITATNQQFASKKAVVITRSSCLKAEISITEAVDQEPYSILIDSKVVSILSDIAQTKEQIASNLRNALDIAMPTVSFIVDGATIICQSKDGYTPFSIITNNYIEVNAVWTPIPMECTITGPTICPKGSLNRIDTLISGWDAITNFAAGVVGTNIETDKELRKRRANSLRIGGAATVESIKARMIQEVSGVSGVSIFENRSRFPDSEGRPAHSFETVISGGDDQLIANQLWLTKPAGIETYGNVSKLVTDSQGDQHMIYFSRPVDIYCWVRCTVYLYDEEEFQADGLERIKEVIYLVGEGLGVGNDVIIQRFHGGIYKFTTGVGKVVLQVATSTSPEIQPQLSEYTDQNLALSLGETAKFHRDRIVVSLGV